MRLVFLALGVGVLLYGVAPAARAARPGDDSVAQRERQTTAQWRLLRRFLARNYVYCRLADGETKRTYYSDLFSLDGARESTQRISAYSLAFRGAVMARFAGARGEAGCSADGDATSVKKRFQDDQYQDVIQHNAVLLTGWSPGGSRPQGW